MGRGKSSTLQRRGKRLSGCIETAEQRRERMGTGLQATLAAADDYDKSPEAFETALDELAVSLGNLGANMGADGPSETIEVDPPSRDDLIRNSLGRSLLWARKEGLPQSLQGPLYPVLLTESRWRKLPKELRAAITYYGFKRDFVGRPAQYAYERLDESRLPREQLDAFEQAMLVYA